jgi:type VI secretion system protein ImpA
LETYWDGIHPRLDPDDDNDPRQRVNILSGLCDSEGVLRYLQNTPLVESRAFGRFSLRDIQIANGKLPAPAEGDVASPATIRAGFAEVAGSAPDSLLATQTALNASLETVSQIEAFVTEQVGVSNAPSLQPLRDKLKESLYAVGEQIALCGLGAAAVSADVEIALASPAAMPMQALSPPAGPQLGGINNRQDVIRALDLICGYYAKFEPSSPIPLLVKRAKRLVHKDFMAIMEDLAPDGLSQIQTLKGHDPEEEG